MRLLACLSLIALLAGCATPRETCIAERTRDIKVVDALIERDLATLERGYALDRETRVTPRLQLCNGLVSVGGRIALGTSTCFEPRAETRVVPEAVDLDAVRRRLESLERKRVELVARTRAGVEACRAAYPVEAAAAQ